jgi:hypothetical protein
MGQGGDDYYNFYEPEKEKNNKVKGFLGLSACFILMVLFVRVIGYFLSQLQL